MPEVVKVSTVETQEKLMGALEDYFKKGRYAEMTQVIGMHSILRDAQHTLEDQRRLYRTVLDMIKNRTAVNLGGRYSSWYTQFPDILDTIISGGEIVTDRAAAQILDSRRASYGTFVSAEDFFFWALDDRRLTLDEIVRYLERTAEQR